MISAKVIADSVNPAGKRLTTLELTFPRWILAEVNTHRVLSRNSASSRAIPTKRILWSVLRNPAQPVAWGRNQAGMQARSELGGLRRWLARRLFFLARYPALLIALLLTWTKLHKQITNRILEPWMWHTAIVTSTEWRNLINLRLHPDAQPEFQQLTRCLQDAMVRSTPDQIPWGGWHLPYVDGHSMVGPIYGPDDPFLEIPKCSAACCARVSYVRQSDRKSVAEDIKFSDRLIKSGHWSPFEHPAQAVDGYVGGNFLGGWQQLRKFYAGEDGNG